MVDAPVLGDVTTNDGVVLLLDESLPEGLAQKRSRIARSRKHHQSAGGLVQAMNRINPEANRIAEPLQQERAWVPPVPPVHLHAGGLVHPDVIISDIE